MVDVLVPLEGEGADAVIALWFCQVGDWVEKDAPLLELETDKVSLEVPAPVSGRLAEILRQKGDKVAGGAIVARIEAGQAQEAPAKSGRDLSSWRSPAVKKALAETGLDPTGMAASGREGRLTVADVAKAAEQTKGNALPPASLPSAANGESHMIAHDPMRLAIARNMLASVTEAPQVTALFEADFSAIAAHRARHRQAFEAEGIALSYTAYFAIAAAKAMQLMPQVNSRWHVDKLEIFQDVNIGIATALGEKGLVVPVLRRVQDLSLQGVASRLQALTRRARNGTLTLDEMRAGTFTISNHGVSGSLFAAPVIIHQPQSAILGVGKVEKRVVVREVDGIDTIQIRPMAYVSLTIDHRALDGHQTNSWLSAFVAALENWGA